MFSPQVGSPRLETLVVLETEPLQDIPSCMTGDELVELYKTEITRGRKETEVMLNYEKTVIIVAYRRNVKVLVKLHGEEPAVLQPRLVAKTLIFTAKFTRLDPIVV